MLAPAAVDHMHDTKAPADDEGTAKQLLDLLGCGIGGHIEILGLETEQQIAHRTTDDVGLKPRLLERAHHIHSAPIDQLQIDAMHAGRHGFALAKFFAITGIFAQQLMDKGFDHEEDPNKSRMRQPRSCASWRKRASGLVATGWLTASSKGTSLNESL